MGLASMPAAPQAAPMAISNNDVLSVADPQITSSGLLSSSAGTQLSSSYQQQADMKAAERVILPQQAILLLLSFPGCNLALSDALQGRHRLLSIIPRHSGALHVMIYVKSYPHYTFRKRSTFGAEGIPFPHLFWLCIGYINERKGVHGVQVRDVTNLGLQFGNIGFDPSRSFGGSSTVNATSDDIPQQHNAPQAVPERSNAAALSSAPSPPGVDAFNAGGAAIISSWSEVAHSAQAARKLSDAQCIRYGAGMASSLGSYQTSGNTGYSTFSVQAPIASQPAAAAPAPTRLQVSSLPATTAVLGCV